jgi:uncharacterized protein YbjQ (UPF0145 family)
MTTTPTYTAGKFVYAYDFREYSSKGFLFSPYEYKQGQFDIQGIVSISLYPEVIKHTGKPTDIEINKANDEGYFFQKTTIGGELSYYRIQSLTSEDAIREAYLLAIEMDANGISDFEISTELVQAEKGLITVAVLTAKGVAIKRK